MSNIPNGLQLHCAGRVSAAAAVTGAVNAGATNVGTGVWTIDPTTEIDPLDRKTILTPFDAAGFALATLDDTTQTGTAIGVLTFDTIATPVVGDIAWEFLVYRVAIFL